MAERGPGIFAVVDPLPNMHEVLGLNPTIFPKNKLIKHRIVAFTKIVNNLIPFSTQGYLWFSLLLKDFYACNPLHLVFAFSLFL